MSLISVSRLAPRSATWLWRDRFPLGKIVLLDGDPGLGKSFITLDLCARISTGRSFPDGSPTGEPANCMVLNGDDAADDAIHDRLQTLGANLDRVFVPNVESDLRMLHLPADWPKLDQAISGAKIRFLVIDPIMAFLSSRVVTASDQSVREALFPLVLLAEKHGCVILLIRHLNKSRGSRSLYRGGGSIAFQGLCRAAWLVARDPLDTRSCVFANVKNNYAPLQPGLAYVVARTDSTRPTLSWIGAHALPADELLARSRHLMRPVHRAREFLRTFLEDGPRTAGDIWQAARKEGFSKRTLSRAKILLQIRTHWTRANGQCVTHWRLPHHNPPSSQSGKAGDGDAQIAYQRREARPEQTIGLARTGLLRLRGVPHSVVCVSQGLIRKRIHADLDSTGPSQEGLATDPASLEFRGIWLVFQAWRLNPS